jgi:hypothetical protein
MAEKSRLDAIKWRWTQRRLHQPSNIRICVGNLLAKKKIRRLKAVGLSATPQRKSDEQMSRKTLRFRAFITPMFLAYSLNQGIKKFKKVY